MSTVSILFAVLAFLTHGLATDTHHRKRFGTPASVIRRRNLRWMAWMLLALCCLSAFGAKGPVYGAIFWAGATSFGAAVAFLLLNLTPVRRH